MGVHRKPRKTNNGPDQAKTNGKVEDAVAKRSKSKASKLVRTWPTKQQFHVADNARQIFEPRPEWHSAALPDIEMPDSLSVPAPKLIQTIQDYAKELLEAETAAYAQSHQQSSSAHKFYTSIMSTGTWSDKVSALTLLVQESPVHNVKALDNLMGMAAKNNRQQALMALASLKDMFAQGSMLPSDRKLRSFSKQPGLVVSLQGVKPFWSTRDSLPTGLTKEALVVWAYEDYLKSKYFELLRILETWCNDEVEYAKMRTITFVWELLKDKPEQEENLLRLLVSKLGDRDKKVASRASHLLLQTQVAHPSMKSVIIDAIESEILLRPGQNSHAKYYAVITLNQTILSSAAPELANKLLNVYFSLFVSILNKSRNSHRAKDGKDKDDATRASEDTKKRKRPSTAAVSTGEERAEQELEEKITAQVLTGVNRAFPYSKADGATFEKHIDTMFRITHSSNFNTSIQALMLIQQISTSHHISTDRFMRTLYESLLDPRLLKSSKQTMYLNLLYRSLKSDVSVRRVKAFVKRLVQILSLHEPPFASAVLYLILELQTLFPSLHSLLDQPEALEEDEEEVFRDVLSDDEETAMSQQKQNGVSTTSHTLSLAGNKAGYDGRKRDPEHSNADRTCLWELTPWMSHYHPSVTLFANALSRHGTSSAKAPPKPDPQSHTLMHFLDRFVYRNARTKHLSADAVPVRGTSLMQPALGSTSAKDTLYSRDRSASQAQPLNREAFWSQRAEEVAADEVFFHKYFGEIASYKKSAKNDTRKKPADVDDDEWDGDVGAGEDEIWRALVGSRKELGDEDADLELDDASDFDDDDIDIEEAMASDDDGFDAVDDGDEGVELNLESDEEEDEELEVADDAELEFDEDDDLDAEALDVPSQGPKALEDFADWSADDSDDISVHLDSDDADGAAEPPASKRTKTETAAKDKSKASRERKRRLKALPTFASADDYAALIEQHDAPEGGDDWKRA